MNRKKWLGVLCAVIVVAALSGILTGIIGAPFFAFILAKEASVE